MIARASPPDSHPLRYLLRRGGGGTGPSASHERREFSISLGINIPAASVDRKVRGTYGPRENRAPTPAALNAENVAGGGEERSGEAEDEGGQREKGARE